MGNPPLDDCKLVLDNFWTHMVVARGYESDEEIEFLAPGAGPLHANQMPREVMSPDVYTFQGSNIYPTCILQFGIMTGYIFPDMDIAMGSVVSSYNDMNTTAHEIVSQCVADHGMGGAAFVDAYWERPRIVVHVFAAVHDDPILQAAVTNTINYSMQDNYKNKELWPNEPSTDIDEEISATEQHIWGNSGQGSSKDVGNTYSHAYCNAKSTENCWPGWGCKVLGMAEMAKTVVWGFAKEGVLDFVGVCAVELGS
ncbi:MAG: hypothetical protein M1812_005940 [Candelaria pacifica]|nr:MAG: hypothetical protein M1812_005940 [Candelaria pacifica]